MGIRFACHGCGKPLNIKAELAGRRGVCPECRIRFRIPKEDAEYSSPIEEASGARSTSVQAAGSTGAATVGTVAAAVSSGDSADRQVGVSHANSGLGGAIDPVAADDPVAAAIEAIASDTSATWYVRPPSGGQYGPASGELLKQWIGEGRVAKTALLWRDGWPQWREANEALPEISDTLPGANDLGGATVLQNVGPSAEVVNQQKGGGSGSAEASAVAAGSVGVQQPSDLAGSHELGATRRKKTSQRVTTVAVLATLALALVVTLVIVAGRS